MLIELLYALILLTFTGLVARPALADMARHLRRRRDRQLDRHN